MPTRIEKERKAVLAEAQMMNTIEYRIDCQLLTWLHAENNLGCRWVVGARGGGNLSDGGPGGGGGLASYGLALELPLAHFLGSRLGYGESRGGGVGVAANLRGTLREF